MSDLEKDQLIAGSAITIFANLVKNVDNILDIKDSEIDRYIDLSKKMAERLINNLQL